MKSSSLLIILMLISSVVWGHKASDSFMNLTVSNETITARWDIALRDLEYAIALDTNEDGVINWFELRTRQHDIENYAFSGLQVSTFLPNNSQFEECFRQPGPLQVDHHSDGAYAVINFILECPSPVKNLAVSYKLFFNLDPTHRGLVQISRTDNTRFVVFSPENTQATIHFNTSNQWQTVRQFITEGVWHIWIGYDHILFLICLLLPSVVRSTNSTREEWNHNSFRQTLWQVATIVTAFTIAHSITLALGVLQIINLPTRLVESAIALSVIMAAMNNVFPLFKDRIWMIAFGFGLIHGFGFASVLSGLGLTTANLGTALFSFNIGVELGQLAIVFVFLPVAYFSRHNWFYQRVVLHGGSYVILLIAVGWFVQRAFDVSIFTV